VGVLLGAVAIAVALVATPLVRRFAVARGVLDAPGPLKIHREPVPYLGGAAVLLALVPALAATRAWWLVPVVGAAALGIADDVRSLSPRFRLAAQIVVGVAAGAAAPAPGRLGGVVTAVLVVGLANAVNLVDGMDGLASGLVALSAVGFVAIGGDGRVAALALAGALVGFAVFNRPPARIYLGDGGAYLLGTTLAMLAAQALHGHAHAWPAVPLLVGLPAADTAIAIVRRRRARRPVFLGDRSHVYDQLADRGWPVERVLAACFAAQAAVTVAGVVAWHASVGGAVLIAAAAAGAGGALVWKAGLVRAGAAA
jgi:UDP-GlcNAc:undecaprenyl-phosphate GlcNAc-1-phosphate transferase